MRRIFTLSLCLMLSSVSVGVFAQVENELSSALIARLTLPNGRAYVRHCRNAPGGCAARVARFVRVVIEASAANNVDPWLLSAIAVKESGLNADAVGARGELSAFQLNPRRRDARAVRTERDAAFVAAGILSRAMVRCGSIAGALSMYNSGRCDGNTAYAEGALRERGRLAGLAMVAQ